MKCIINNGRIFITITIAASVIYVNILVITNNSNDMNDTRSFPLHPAINDILFSNKQLQINARINIIFIYIITV